MTGKGDWREVAADQNQRILRVRTASGKVWCLPCDAVRSGVKGGGRVSAPRQVASMVPMESQRDSTPCSASDETGLTR